MKGDAIKAAIVFHAFGPDATDVELEIVCEVVDLALDFLADVKRIADANDRLVPLDDPSAV